jgi:antiviral helicase SKI2
MQVDQSEKALTSLKKFECDICKPEIEWYYESVADIVEWSSQLLLMDTGYHKSSKQLLQGRIVVLRDGVCTHVNTKFITHIDGGDPQHFRCHIGVALRAAPLTVSDPTGREKVGTYHVLAVVSPETKAGEHGMSQIAYE